MMIGSMVGLSSFWLRDMPFIVVLLAGIAGRRSGFALRGG